MRVVIPTRTPLNVKQEELSRGISSDRTVVEKYLGRLYLFQNVCGINKLPRKNPQTTSGGGRALSRLLDTAGRNRSGKKSETCRKARKLRQPAAS
ncbi:hypothetical protein PHMEG_0006898 [Phytophthora megakarya]|uniref:Uncharacterized protein n=1 Tax=Phytophthora megakarya TaxID=4795 RepID=A0A225WPZ0_9STRA|nr:hypothetical protein PHMEG_0006898 [Phytophthora megakarya]